MRTNLIMGTTLAAAILLFAAACQNTASNNATTSNANTNMAGHDMSNMSGHDMSNMNGSMSNMSNMSDMMQGHEMTNMNSDPGAADAPFDQQFLDSMIHHHAGAIVMAKMVLGKTQRPELKAFAQKIVDDQSKEIDYMKSLRDQWYAGKPSAINMEMPGMIGGMKMMNSEHMKEMDQMEPEHFDNHFLNMMIAHHEGAVTMSNDALQKAEHPEIKKLAKDILNAQQPEIEQMKKWEAAWAEK